MKAAAHNHRLRSCVLFACMLIVPNHVRASEADTSVDLKWSRSSTADACPEQAELERLVRARLGRNPFAVGAPRTIEATIDYDGESWHVQLHVRDKSGQEQGRRVFDVRAVDCEPVADAVALAVALAIDPNASLAIEPHAAPTAVAAHANADARDDHPTEKSGPSHPRPAPFPYAQLLAPIEVPCIPLSPWQAELSVSGLVAGGLLPGIAPGLGMTGYFGKHHSRLTVGISYFAEAALDPRFSLGQTTADVGYCHEWAQSSSMAASACAAVHAGAQHAVVTGIEPIRPGDRFFAAASVGPRLGWHAWAPLYLEAGAEAWLPFARSQFALAGQATPLFESRSVAVVASIGVGFTTD